MSSQKLCDNDNDAEDQETDNEYGEVDEDDKIIINVAGNRHETLVSTLLKRPRTRLAYVAKRHPRGRRKEYFFDRHPGVFASVMDFYRTGEMHVPLDVCGAVVKKEIDFWQIDECMIEPCCWTCYSSYIDNQKTLSDFNASVKQELEDVEEIQKLEGWRKKQAQIWLTLDHPRSSRLALANAVTSFVFVLASIAGFCLETLPNLKIPAPLNETDHCRDPSAPSDPSDAPNMNSHPVLEYLDYVCTAFFSVEIIIRIIFAPYKKRFFMSPMNLIDILALLPLYVQLFLDLTDKYNCLKNQKAVIETIFILRIIRIFRIFHLVKHYKALKILVHAIKASIQELLMLSIFLIIAMLVFSTLIFYAERPDMTSAGDFNTIPVGFWWAIITMTTVGYGDVYPHTPMGCVLGALCAVWGVLLIALTIPVISNNFTLFYMHARTRSNITQSRMIRKREQEAEDAMLREQNHKHNAKNKNLQDAKVLITSIDSNSTTDESGIMLAKCSENMTDTQIIDENITEMTRLQPEDTCTPAGSETPL